jgi:gas vesicle protein
MKLARKPDNHGKQVAAVAAAGAAAGALAAVLLTPKSGKEVRGGMKQRASSMKHKMKSDRDMDDHDQDVSDVDGLS